MTSNRPYLLRALYDWISDNRCTPHVLVDASVQGVRVPPQAVKNGQVVLNLSMDATADLELGDEWVHFKARFGGVSHAVSFPVAAVLAIYAQENGQGMMFADEGSDNHPPTPPGPGSDRSAESQPDELRKPKDRPGGHKPPRLRVVK